MHLQSCMPVQNVIKLTLVNKNLLNMFLPAPSKKNLACPREAEIFLCSGSNVKNDRLCKLQ